MLFRSDTILISLRTEQNFTFAADTGSMLHVTGLLYTSSDRGVAIWPRNDSDIHFISAGVEPTNPLALSLRVSPNPGTAHRVSFALPQKTRVELGVYDLLGRRVAVLAKGEFPAGEYTRMWDGRGTNGNRAAAGVYFYRLIAGKEVRTVRAVKLN